MCSQLLQSRVSEWSVSIQLLSRQTIIAANEWYLATGIKMQCVLQTDELTHTVRGKTTFQKYNTYLFMYCAYRDNIDTTG